MAADFLYLPAIVFFYSEIGCLSFTYLPYLDARFDFIILDEALVFFPLIDC